MNLTRADALALGRCRARPVKKPGDLIAVFVPVPLSNPLNGSHGHWSKRRKWSKDRREATHQEIFAFMGSAATVLFLGLGRATKKRISFHAVTRRAFDDDNLRAALKPYRDAMKDAGLVDDDGPESGHEFVYSQEATRMKSPGVEIRIRLRTP